MNKWLSLLCLTLVTTYLLVLLINWEHHKVQPFWNALGTHHEHGGNKLITRCGHNKNSMGTLWEQQSLKKSKSLPYDES
jgi:hypothetical protein